MPEPAATLILLCLALLPLALLVPVLGRRYVFSRDGLTVISLWVVRRRVIPFDQVRLEAMGIPRQELPRLRERLPECRLLDLTRTWFPRWSVCGFVSTPDALLMLPHPVARALISKNPQARWTLTRLETRQRLARLPRRMVETWPRWLRIGNLPAALALLVVSGMQMTTAARALLALYHEYAALPGIPSALLRNEMLSLAVVQFSGPLLAITCAGWLAAVAWQRRKAPLFILVLALLAVLAGGFLNQHNAHELSHALKWDCGDYGQAMQVDLLLGLGCCAVLLGRPLLRRWLAVQDGKFVAMAE